MPNNNKITIQHTHFSGMSNDTMLVVKSVELDDNIITNFDEYYRVVFMVGSTIEIENILLCSELGIIVEILPVER